MGAEVFIMDQRGETAQRAFDQAVQDALYWSGHGGYTGTIAEKEGFVMVECPEDRDPTKYADELIDKDDQRIADKWGPAGCIEMEPGFYLFFGWASS